MALINAFKSDGEPVKIPPGFLKIWPDFYSTAEPATAGDAPDGGGEPEAKPAKASIKRKDA